MQQVDTEGQEILNTIEQWASCLSGSIARVTRTPGSIQITPERENAARLEFVLEVGDFFTVGLNETSLELRLCKHKAVAFCEAVSSGRCCQVLHFDKRGQQSLVESKVELSDGEQIHYKRELWPSRRGEKVEHVQFEPWLRRD